MPKQTAISKLLERFEELFSLPPCEDKDYKVSPISQKLQQQVFEEQDGLCYLCGTDTSVPRTHHIKPDGKTSRDNLVMLCSECHFWVHKLLHKYLGYQRVIRYTGG